MNRKHFTTLVALAAFLAVTFAPAFASRSPNMYSIEWYVVAAGGSTYSTSNNGYVLGSTVGQSGAGLTSGSGYELTGGFWPGVAGQWNAYVPLLMK